MLQICLEVTSKDRPDAAPQQFQSPLPIKIGSLAANKLRLDGAKVSRTHAIIQQDAHSGAVVIADLSSVTGTGVDGRAVGREVLKVGSVITIGDHTLHVASIEDAAAKPLDPQLPTPEPQLPTPEPQLPTPDAVMCARLNEKATTAEAVAATAEAVAASLAALETTLAATPTAGAIPSDEVLGLQHDLAVGQADLEAARRAVKRARGVARFFQWCAATGWPAPTWAEAEQIAQLVDDMTSKLNLGGFSEEDVYVVAAALTQTRILRAQRQGNVQVRQRPGAGAPMKFSLGDLAGAPIDDLMNLLFGR